MAHLGDTFSDKSSEVQRTEYFETQDWHRLLLFIYFYYMLLAFHIPIASQTFKDQLNTYSLWGSGPGNMDISSKGREISTFF